MLINIRISSGCCLRATGLWQGSLRNVFERKENWNVLVYVLIDEFGCTFYVLNERKVAPPPSAQTLLSAAGVSGRRTLFFEYKF